jgi:two-component system chemotaxis sensor kinase CheA
MSEADDRGADDPGEAEARNRDLSLALDSLDEGLLVLDGTGAVTRVQSAVVARWFGAITPGTAFGDFVETFDPRAGLCFQDNWSQLGEGLMPLELTLDQLPRTMVAADRRYDLRYTPRVEDQVLTRLVVRISDVTDRWTAELAEADQRDVIRGFEHALCDRMGFLEFFDEANSLVHRVCAPVRAPLPDTRRWLHTLKGNAMLFGLRDLAALCHELEDEMGNTQGDLGVAARRVLKIRWESFAGRIGTLLGATDQKNIAIDDGQYDALLGALREGRPLPEIVEMLASWRLELAAERLSRQAAYASSLAERLGKGTIDASVEAGSLRLGREIMVSFWGAFAHAVRNAVAHGLESPDQRVALGKPPAGALRLAAWRADARICIQIADDGRGIDWEGVRAKARAAGLPSATAADLRAALFHDGVSTSDGVDGISGRGVGMGALLAECENLDGTIEITSVAGAGTTLLFSFPAAMVGDDARSDLPTGLIARAGAGAPAGPPALDAAPR